MKLRALVLTAISLSLLISTTATGTATSSGVGVTRVQLSGAAAARESAAREARPHSPNTAGDITSFLATADAAIRHGKCSADLIDRLTAALEHDPNNQRLHRMLGEVFQLSGYEDLAREQFLLANKHDSEYLLKLFHARMMGTDLGNTKNIYPIVKELYPNDGGVIYYEAFREQTRGNQLAALMLLRKEVHLANPWPHSMALLAEMEAGLGMWEEAFRHSNEALMQDNKDAQALSVRMRAELHNGRSLLSLLPELEMAYGLNKADPFLCLMLAQAYIAKRDYQHALEPALRAMVMPYGPPVHTTENVVNELYQRLPSRTFLDGVNAAASDITNPVYRPYFRMRMSELFEQNQKHDFAHKQLQVAVISGEASLNPQLAIELGNLAQHKYQDYALAYHFYQQAREKDPNNGTACRAQERLLDRLCNYKNDLAWQLKTQLWGTSKLIPALRFNKAKPYGSANAASTDTH